MVVLSMNDPTLIDGVVIIYLVLIAAICICTILDDKFLEVIKTPSDVYDKTGLNWTFALIVFLLYIVFLPINYMLGLCWWLMHVGRSDWDGF